MEGEKATGVRQSSMLGFYGERVCRRRNQPCSLWEAQQAQLLSYQCISWYIYIYIYIIYLFIYLYIYIYIYISAIHPSSWSFLNQLLQLCKLGHHQLWFGGSLGSLGQTFANQRTFRFTIVEAIYTLYIYIYVPILAYIQVSYQKAANLSVQAHCIPQIQQKVRRGCKIIPLSKLT